MKQNNRQIGSDYESKAAEYLENNGYDILHRNLKNHGGEIDIIALDNDDSLVFIEVKYRKNNQCGSPLDAVGLAKQRKICKAALLFLAANAEYYQYSIRFDVIGFEGKHLVHIKNAFEFVN